MVHFPLLKPLFWIWGKKNSANHEPFLQNDDFFHVTSHVRNTLPSIFCWRFHEPKRRTTRWWFARLCIILWAESANIAHWGWCFNWIVFTVEHIYSLLSLIPHLSRITTQLGPQENKISPSPVVVRSFFQLSADQKFLVCFWKNRSEFIVVYPLHQRLRRVTCLLNCPYLPYSSSLYWKVLPHWARL